MIAILLFPIYLMIGACELVVAILVAVCRGVAFWYRVTRNTAIEDARRAEAWERKKRAAMTLTTKRDKTT